MELRARSDYREQLREYGYAVMPAFTAPHNLVTLNEIARAQLAARSGPLELETDLQYPGAPASRHAPGGDTVRRLLDAYSRNAAFAHWATAVFAEPLSESTSTTKPWF